MQSEVSGQCYNVGRGIGTFHQGIERVAASVDWQPAFHSIRTRRIDVCDESNRFAERAEKDLGYQWTIDLEEGMRSLIEWPRFGIERLYWKSNGVVELYEYHSQ
jgi:nucleoside-diphosphate-sugar epimerase